jgi:glycosyltransferase involved in cell wall biosynthesis
VTSETRERAIVLERALLTDRFEPAYPDPSGSVPLVVHAPSAPIAKGTGYIERALDSLRGDVEFEYVQLQGVPRDEAMRLVARADVFIDQVVIGDYGMAAIEAMAFGKPTVAWVKPSVRANYPDDLPVVNADPSGLHDALGGLLASGERRRDIGVASRAFVERYHDAHGRAKTLLPHYLAMAGMTNADFEAAR